MDNKTERLMDYLEEAVEHPDVSGFEVLEILDMRSQLASREPLLNEADKHRLERLDKKILLNADTWATRISEIGDIETMRERTHVLPSHWWWYLDEMRSVEPKAAV